MHENLLSLSTHALTSHDRPKKFASAAEAVRLYFEWSAKAQGCPGIDPERLMDLVQSRPSPENPHLEKVLDLGRLREVFRKSCRRAQRQHRYGPMYAYAWCLCRMRRRSLSEAGEGLRVLAVEGQLPHLVGDDGQARKPSKRSVARYVAAVDGLVEEELARRNLLYKGCSFDDEGREIRAEASRW